MGIGILNKYFLVLSFHPTLTLGLAMRLAVTNGMLVIMLQTQALEVLMYLGFFSWAAVTMLSGLLADERDQVWQLWGRRCYMESQAPWKN